MPKQPTIDPKERVNIVYQSKLTDGNTETELPFKLLVIGDFTQSQDQEPLESRKSISVTKENFDAVLKGLGTKISMWADNQLDYKGGRIPINLQMNSMKDFEPGRLVENVEPLKKVASLRNSLIEAIKLIQARPKLFADLKNTLTDPQSGPELAHELKNYRGDLP
jgi:type VI secretion system protein ImpB